MSFTTCLIAFCKHAGLCKTFWKHVTSILIQAASDPLRGLKAQRFCYRNLHPIGEGHSIAFRLLPVTTRTTAPGRLPVVTMVLRDIRGPERPYTKGRGGRSGQEGGRDITSNNKMNSILLNSSLYILGAPRAAARKRTKTTELRGETKRAIRAAFTLTLSIGAPRCREKEGELTFE